MSGLHFARAVVLGLTGAIIAEGWRAYVAVSLLILATLLTDWIAETDAKKRERAIVGRLARGMRGQP